MIPRKTIVLVAALVCSVWILASEASPHSFTTVKNAFSIISDVRTSLASGTASSSDRGKATTSPDAATKQDRPEPAFGKTDKK
ncbi:MAG: hypothetical protein A4E57_00461 [Syntrophorhabdaceae bacterium PtaU1.Bin034]|nr:MAG: hypothetical protein A4E57_00461 [Syntrophorhabdaceae bacterium PtaU1.Bin034]